ncbi:MAG: serine/threonine protein kinase [Candidatus Omnitrophica bacterium]|nr:serine/threonine protein kinase [Candidatus Omnitrophota bacterium]
MLLPIGQIVQLEKSQRQAEVKALLGGGGEGEVYLVRAGREDLALKWYFENQATPNRRTRLEFLVEKGAPTSDFLWMQEIATSPSTPGFGYVMPLRGRQFQGFNRLLSGDMDPTFRSLAMAGYHLASSFYALHTEGLSYHDISHNNIFLDPFTGKIQVCDNDNVGIDGDSDVDILGTPKYMAPEIVRGEALPTTQTDLHSLAVLLFMMLVMSHPFDGMKEAGIRCMDPPAMKKVYGMEPVFVFHPTDRSNRPHPQYHQNALEYWPLYPAFLWDLFTRAFTDGLVDPKNGRVREYEWRKAMLRLRDSIVSCPRCRKENFYCSEAVKQHAGALGKCWGCGEVVPCPPRLRIGGNVVMLGPDTQIVPHHFKQDFGLDTPVAEVVKGMRSLSLKNCGNDTWEVIRADSQSTRVASGEAVRLNGPCKIKFGAVEGEIRV